jgi:hypothetical protein
MFFDAYRLEAYATLLFGAASDGPRSCGITITHGPSVTRRRRNVGYIRTMSDAFQVFAVLRFVGAIKASLDGVNEYRLEATTVRL